MGKRGPKPKPSRLRALEGNSSSGEILHNELQPIAPVNKPPAIKRDKRLSDIWDRVVSSMPPGLYSQADTGALTAYVQAVAFMWGYWHEIEIAAERNKAVNEKLGEPVDPTDPVARGLLVYQHNGDVKVNPAFKAWKEAALVVNSTGSSLGLTPSARSRMTNPETQPKQSKFAGLLQASTVETLDQVENEINED